MPIGLLEQQILSDNPCAPIVKFACSDEEDMFDEQFIVQSNLGRTEGIFQ